ncbi:uracil-DNA glycosylase [Methylobacillus flagellatus]|uniref:uracil-DNA glycosylase n=1 Tax=Methylobacillus flagellatus TaxID=405 RepID=UPI0010F54125|nr:uracil-DNA glycosylase [Methylobacillus flagellatus]
MNTRFDSACRLCPRLSGFLDQVKLQHPDYYARPVPPFGVDEPALLIVGLAPGMHGANRSGRPFTGDYAGVLLYDTLHRFGYASAPVSVSADDGLQLIGCRISNAVKCLPPENKPTTQEINTCNRYLANEIEALPTSTVILALGNVAHLAVLKALGLKPAGWKFGHAARHALPDGRVLYDSYHCSRYNTQTRRLTEPMFHQVFAQIQLEARS